MHSAIIIIILCKQLKLQVTICNINNFQFTVIPNAIILMFDKDDSASFNSNNDHFITHVWYE